MRHKPDSLIEFDGNLVLLEIKGGTGWTMYMEAFPFLMNVLRDRMGVRVLYLYEAHDDTVRCIFASDITPTSKKVLISRQRCLRTGESLEEWIRIFGHLGMECKSVKKIGGGSNDPALKINRKEWRKWPIIEGGKILKNPK